MVGKLTDPPFTLITQILKHCRLSIANFQMNNRKDPIGNQKSAIGNPSQSGDLLSNNA